MSKANCTIGAAGGAIHDVHCTLQAGHPIGFILSEVEGDHGIHLPLSQLGNLGR